MSGKLKQAKFMQLWHSPVNKFVTLLFSRQAPKGEFKRLLCVVSGLNNGITIK